MMCSYKAHLYHMKVAGIIVQMPHNGAPDCCSIQLCLHQEGITHPSTINIQRDQFGIKEEDYLSEYGFTFSPLCVCNCAQDKEVLQNEDVVYIAVFSLPHA